MKQFILPFAFLLFVALMPVAPESSAADRPCQQDIAKFCGKVTPGQGAIMRCLEEHRAELSAGCRERQSELLAKATDVRQACRSDRNRYCKDVAPGQGRIFNCLRENRAALSTSCKAELDKPLR